MFQNAHHNAILRALRDLDGDLFSRAECYFGGGTAITLALGEYRESVDMDFLCASREGYALLRKAIWGTGLPGLLRAGATLGALRDLRTDQYGIRTILAVDDMPIRFEIVREARIDLGGAMNDDYGVPVLSRIDMYAEKLLANDDRWSDPSVMSRDIIDLSMMIARWGPIPEAAWAKAVAAYGGTVRASYAKAVERMRDPGHLGRCMAAMGMAPGLAGAILAVHGGAKAGNTGMT